MTAVEAIPSSPETQPESARALAAEVRTKGWIVFSSQSESKDWDLFLCRPDGSDRRKITGTPAFNEGGARFSPDGTKLLFYRMPKSEPLDNNTYGTFDLVVAHADGCDPVVYGAGFPWASWSSDGTQLACLAPKGIRIFDVASRKLVRELPRKGIVQQLVWSPDGKWFVGTANSLGPFWNIARLDPGTGELIALSETERYNCTPDWAPDSRHVVYARGIIPQKGGHAELWLASADGRGQRMLYGEESRHIYGALVSPDGKYLLFTRSVEDLGRVDNSQTTMALIRWSDTPMVADPRESLRKQLPDVKPGPRLDLGPGWEPHWTYGDGPASAGERRK